MFYYFFLLLSKKSIKLILDKNFKKIYEYLFMKQRKPNKNNHEILSNIFASKKIIGTLKTKEQNRFKKKKKKTLLYGRHREIRKRIGKTVSL